MFIQIQETPNPSTLQFMLDENILKGNTTHHFAAKEEAAISPLALALFEIEDVKIVFLGSNFVSVTIAEGTSWEVIKHKVLGYINSHISAGKPVITGEVEEQFKVEASEKDKPIVAALQELFQERIRPAVAMDGGDIVLKGYKEGVVYINMQGSCSGCPSSTMTLKNGIENMLKYYIPEVQEVVSIE